MDQNKKNLDRSIRCYQLLLEHVHNFKTALENGALTTKQYNEFHEKLTSLQSQVEEADSIFTDYFDRKSDTLITNSLLAQKESMMKEILELNDYLLPRLASLMDITRDELNSLKKNVRTIHGYHSGTNSKQSGKILKRTG